VIPTRDRWPLLSSTALPSALGQEGVHHEVLVVDDASVDGTDRGLAAIDDPRLRVVRNERTEGVARARNRGIAEARGEWVAFLDDDDLWSPRKLRAQLDAARAIGAGFAYAAGVVVDESVRALRSVAAPDPATVRGQLLRRNVVGGPSTVVARRDLLRSTGGFDESLAVLADWELWIRLSRAARAAACHEPLVAYVEHSDNMSVTAAREVFAELDRLVGRRAAVGAEHVDLVDFTHWVALQHRRAGRPLAAAGVYLRGAVRSRSRGLLARGLVVPLGESAMALPGRLVGRRAQPPPVSDPAWLELYRPGAESPPVAAAGQRTR
jgi:glycosyltransferase involved in cell wall biosynthesis